MNPQPPHEGTEASKSLDKKTADGEPGRSGDGRFAAGNPGGPGRPRRVTSDQVLEMLGTTFTQDAVMGVMGGLVAKARDGDIQAIRLFFELAFGKKLPNLRLNPDVMYLAVPRNFGANVVPENVLPQDERASELPLATPREPAKRRSGRYGRKS